MKINAILNILILEFLVLENYQDLPHLKITSDRLNGTVIILKPENTRTSKRGCQFGFIKILLFIINNVTDVYYWLTNKVFLIFLSQNLK